MTATITAPPPHVDSIKVDFLSDVPSAPVSLDNALTIGRELWRVLMHRTPQLVEGSVVDLKGHYAEVFFIDGARVATEWIDGRSVGGVWHRHQVLAVLALSHCFGYHTPEWLAGVLYRICEPGEKLRPHQCVARLKETQGMTWHPKTIARAFRWLASYGMAVRTNKARKGRWSVIRF